MSSNPTPTDLFADLSLDSTSMAPTAAEVRSRASQLQDILSAFHESELPSEFRLQIVANIDRVGESRPRSSDWTISADLQGTLLQWGAYDNKAWDFLRQLQSPRMRARAFHEKLGRRFNACLNDYHELVDSTDVLEIKESKTRSQHLREEVNKVASSILKLATAVQEDRQHREHGEVETLAVLLSALNKVCEANQNIVPAQMSSQPKLSRSTRRSSSLTETPLSLYDVMIRTPASDMKAQPFPLDALEQFSGDALQERINDLIAINGVLNRNGAPADYIERFEALQQRALEASQLSKSRAQIRGRTRELTPEIESSFQEVLEPEPRTGSKRAADNTGRSGGRKRGTK